VLDSAKKIAMKNDCGRCLAKTAIISFHHYLLINHVVVDGTFLALSSTNSSTNLEVKPLAPDRVRIRQGDDVVLHPMHRVREDLHRVTHAPLQRVHSLALGTAVHGGVVVVVAPT